MRSQVLGFHADDHRIAAMSECRALVNFIGNGLAWLAVRAYPVARAEFEADARRRAEQAIALIRRADQRIVT